MELCLEAERKPGMRLSRRWWEQHALDILGIRTGHATLEGGGRRGQKNLRQRESRVGADYGEGML